MNKIKHVQKQLIFLLIFVGLLVLIFGFIIWQDKKEQNDTRPQCTEQQIRQMRYDPTYNAECKE